ncbi:MAG TPA: hypothetical protein VMA36_09605 [Candidatus Limnocylindria bacterium]|nr:hypothetical protein [Candidatus Limnocylindria bacterium]
MLGNEIDGATIQDRIDQTIVPKLRDQYPDLTIGASRCPRTIDVGFQETGECTLPIEGTMLPIEVSAVDGTDGFRVRPEDVVVERAAAEDAIRAEARYEYAAQLDAQCDGAPVQAVQSGAPLHCAVSGPGLRRHPVVVTALRSGDVEVDAFRIPELRTIYAMTVGPYLRAHASGARTIVPGTVLARYVRMSSRSLLDGEIEERGVLGAARCPEHADLTGTHGVHCTIAVGGATLELWVWIASGESLLTEASKAVVDTARVEADAARAYGGMVFCGRDRVVVVDPGSTLACAIHSAEGTRPVPVTITDLKGTPHFAEL